MSSRELPNNIVISLRYSHLLSVPVFFIIIRRLLLLPFVIIVIVVADVIHNIYIVCIIYICVCACVHILCTIYTATFVLSRFFVVHSFRIDVLYILFCCVYFIARDSKMRNRDAWSKALFHPWMSSVNIKANNGLCSLWLNSKCENQIKKKN